MRKTLEEIGTITTGIYEKGHPGGDTYYLQAKHFDEYGKFRKDVILSPEIHLDGRLSKHLLENKDLLIMAKGERNKACLYEEEIGQSLGSSTFFVLRINAPNILPEYLQWFINTSKMQELLSNLSKGSHIRSLSKKELSKVKIDIPPLEQQEQVLKLLALWEKERVTIQELLDQKELFYQNLLFNLATSKEIKK